MGDDQDGAEIVAQVAFEPAHRTLASRWSVGSIEQQPCRLFEKQPAERNPAPLAAGQLGDVGIIGRAA